mgnify:CR=1 FL=1
MEPDENRAVIKVKNADLAMAKVLELFNPPAPAFESDIHPKLEELVQLPAPTVGFFWGTGGSDGAILYQDEVHGIRSIPTETKDDRSELPSEFIEAWLDRLDGKQTEIPELEKKTAQEFHLSYPYRKEDYYGEIEKTIEERPIHLQQLNAALENFWFLFSAAIQTQCYSISAKGEILLELADGYRARIQALSSPIQRSSIRVGVQLRERKDDEENVVDVQLFGYKEGDGHRTYNHDREEFDYGKEYFIPGVVKIKANELDLLILVEEFRFSLHHQTLHRILYNNY